MSAVTKPGAADATPNPAPAKQARGNVIVDQEECKGCALCVESCPPECLELLPGLNAYGVHPAHYTGEDCTGCGICFYCCPEPGAITVYRLSPHSKPLTKDDKPQAGKAAGTNDSSVLSGDSHAAAL